MRYEDPRIGVTADALTIRGYYFPGTVKRIPLSAIRSVTRVEMGRLGGRGRIWGTANPRYWANLDLGRPRKTVAFLVDVGKAVQPFVTPDDPAMFEDALRQAGVGVEPGGPSHTV